MQREQEPLDVKSSSLEENKNNVILNTCLNNVSEAMTSTQSKIHFFNGDVIDNDGLQSHVIETELTSSYVFVNIKNQTLTFTGKFNHLIITKCKNLKLNMIKAISGIDVMNSSNIELNIEDFDYISLFGCSDSIINDNNSISNENGIIHLSCCLDVHHNEKPLRCNPYINIAHRNNQYEIVPSYNLNNLRLSMNDS
jgi:hypothetical protein